MYALSTLVKYETITFVNLCFWLYHVEFVRKHKYSVILIISSWCVDDGNDDADDDDGGGGAHDMRK